MTDREPHTWTDDQVVRLMELAFESGQLHERVRIAAGIVELDEAWIANAQRLRVDLLQERIDHMQPHDPDWLTKSAERGRGYGATVLEIATHHDAITDWRQIHASVTESVWTRIWFDLCSDTQRQLQDLTPSAARGHLQLVREAA